MSPRENTKLFLQRIWKILKIGLINLLTIVIILEISLQLISLVIKEDRSNASALKQGISILALGDSNTFGMYVTAEQAWPAQLEKIINQNEVRATVYNYGFPGNSTTRIAENLKDMVALTQPDLVLILSGVNDGWNYPVNYSLNEKDNGPLAQLLEKSRIVRFFKILLRSNPEKYIDVPRHFGFPEKDESERQKYLDENVSPENAELNKGVDVTINGKIWKLGPQLKEDADKPFRMSRKNIERNYVRTTNDIKNYLHEKQIPLVILNYASNISRYKRANDRLHLLTEDIVTFDITQEFQLSCKNENCDNLLFEDQHPNANGHRFYAELVYNALLDHAETENIFNQ